MLQWADTFNKYGTTAALLLNGLYANNFNTALVADPDPTAVGKKVAQKQQSGLTIEDGLRYPFPGGAAATMGGGARLWLDKLPLAGTEYIGVVLCDVGNTPQVGFRFLSTGAIEIVTGSSIGLSGGTVIGSTSIPVMAPNSWNHYEWKTTINNSTGSFELRINGVAVISLSGVDTQNSANASVAQLIFANSRNVTSNAANMYVKDFVVWDTTGTYNNNFLGAVQVTDIDPASDVSLTWTPSTGTNGWSILDNNPPVDTTYISAATPLSNTFGLADLPPDTTTVRGLVLINRSWKIDGGDGNVQMGIISGASTGLGTDRPITTAPTYWRDVMEVDPATGVPFTPSGFNAANLKQSRTV